MPARIKFLRNLKKPRVLIISLLVTAGAAVGMIWFWSLKTVKMPLDGLHITSARIWSNILPERELHSAEINDLMIALKSAKNVVLNDFEGITPGYGIYAECENGGTMLINEARCAYGDIEVQYKGRAYWVDDVELAALVRRYCGLDEEF
ncbi:MAG: hypothetical protein BWY11_01047 [Firmicutes bacterium ADurb.Bin182]|nr:MAG: hypothetical protein BWY11_01047 [Firmicutes bacterium ADurb.Bin182]